MNLATWASSLVGHRVTAPEGLGGQCVDLANLYITALGLPVVHRNASMWVPPLPSLVGMVWETNKPLNNPPPGAVVVWSANLSSLGIGSYGHIAIALLSDTSRLITLDQNWPEGNPVAVTFHTYQGVAGWWKAKPAHS